jgi:antitoxin ParD1/3/4
MTHHHKPSSRPKRSGEPGSREVPRNTFLRSRLGLRPSGMTTGGNLAKFCQDPILSTMGTMNISLPDSLKSFVDEQVTGRGYGTSSEYVRELIRADQDRQRLRALLLDGAAAPVVATADDSYFNGLRKRVRRAKPE